MNSLGPGFNILPLILNVHIPNSINKETKNKKKKNFQLLYVLMNLQKVFRKTFAGGVYFLILTNNILVHVNAYCCLKAKKS